MKINIVQINTKTGNVQENLQKVFDELEKPQAKEALLSVFPANTLCGSPLLSSVVYTDL